MSSVTCVSTVCRKNLRQWRKAILGRHVDVGTHPGCTGTRCFDQNGYFRIYAVFKPNRQYAHDHKLKQSSVVLLDPPNEHICQCYAAYSVARGTCAGCPAGGRLVRMSNQTYDIL